MPGSQDTARLSFSGHETFPFRYAWLPKGVELVRRDASLFLRDEGMVELGVGKNMVASIRHWCEALELISFDGRSGEGRVEELGNLLFGEDGWDPYLEHPATLWLLQWQLVRKPTPATTWHYAFTRWDRNLFRRDDLVLWLSKIATHSGDKRTSLASLRRDVDVFLRTYVSARPDSHKPVEDSYDCPLGELGLIEELEDGLYQIVRGERPSLPIDVFSFVLADYWADAAAEQDTLSFERLLYGAGSPGGGFQLSERGLTGLLEHLPGWSHMVYDESAGLRRVVRKRSLDRPQALRALGRFFQREGR